jgi:hypothetical protein
MIVETTHKDPTKKESTENNYFQGCQIELVSIQLRCAETVRFNTKSRLRTRKKSGHQKDCSPGWQK